MAATGLPEIPTSPVSRGASSEGPVYGESDTSSADTVLVRIHNEVVQNAQKAALEIEVLKGQNAALEGKIREMAGQLLELKELISTLAVRVLALESAKAGTH